MKTLSFCDKDYIISIEMDDTLVQIVSVLAEKTTFKELVTILSKINPNGFTMSVSSLSPELNNTVSLSPTVEDFLAAIKNTYSSKTVVKPIEEVKSEPFDMLMINEKVNSK